jgi:hypothetical protein
MRVILDIPLERVEWLRQIEWLRDQLPEDVRATDPTEGPISAAVLAKRLGMSPQWCRDHAAELGGQRRGSGPKARWRFEWHKARELAEQMRHACRISAPEPSRRRPRPRKTDAEGLLPIRARE